MKRISSVSIAIAELRYTRRTLNETPSCAVATETGSDPYGGEHSTIYQGRPATSPHLARILQQSVLSRCAVNVAI